MSLRSALFRLALAFLLAGAGCAGSAPPQTDPGREVLDLSPVETPKFNAKYIVAPFVSIFAGPAYMYSPRTIEVDTTPSGGSVDLFYVRSGFQKRFEQAETPFTLVLPSRLRAGSRDSFTIRAFAEGYRQESVTFRVNSRIEEVILDLEPLPNLLVSVSHRYFAGRASMSFLTSESAVFRIQEADDGFALILNETAASKDARSAVDAVRGPFIDEGYSQQLGEDLMVKLVLSTAGKEMDVRSRQRYDAPRDLHEFAVDWVPSDGGAQAVDRALSALARLTRDDVSGCALAFDDGLRARLEAGALARALMPRGSFTDPYLRAAMRRLGELSVDGVVDFVDGSRFRPTIPIELEMSISKASTAKGYLALLRAFVAQLEAREQDRAFALRSLLAPDRSESSFGDALAQARSAESSCRGLAAR